MVHLKSLALTALATLYAVSATPVQVTSEKAVLGRDDTPAPGEPFYSPESNSVEVNRREAFPSPGEPYYNAGTSSIEIVTPSSGGPRKQRSAPAPGTPGRGLVRIYYDQAGRIRAVMTTTAAAVVQTAFESVANEVSNVASAIADSIGLHGTWAADYNPNEAANTVTIGVNFDMQTVQRAQGVANQIQHWVLQNGNCDVQTNAMLIGNALEAQLADGATPVNPPPSPGGPNGKMMMMERQASATDFCTAPIAKTYNLIIPMPNGATTGGTANAVHC